MVSEPFCDLHISDHEDRCEQPTIMTGNVKIGEQGLKAPLSAPLQIIGGRFTRHEGREEEGIHAKQI